MAEKLEIVLQATDKASGELNKVKGALSGLGDVLGGALKFGAAGALGLGAVGVAVGAVGFQFNAMKEQAQIAFETMLGSGEKATAFLNDLQQFAAKTPFEFPDLVSASQKLLAMGFTAEEVVPTLTAIGDAVAGLGGGPAQIDQVTRALGQMKAKGKASAEEMLQLTEAGIPAWQFLADAIGTDVAGAMDKVSKGAVNADTVIGAVTKGMTKKFGGMMEAQSQTFDGMLSTLKDNATQAAGLISQPFFELATQGIGQVVEVLNRPDVQEGIKQFAADLAAGLASIGTFLQTQVLPALAQFGNFLQAQVLPALQAFGQFLAANVLPGLAQFAGWLGGTLLTAVQQFATWIGGNLVPALTVMVEKIATAALPALQAFGNWLNTTGLPALQQLANFLGPLIGAALGVIGNHITQTLIPAFTDFAVFLVAEALPALGELANLLGEKLNLAVQTFSDLWAGINRMWSEGAAFLIAVRDALEDVARVLLEVIAPAFQWFQENVLAPFNQALAGLAAYIAKLIEMLNKLAGMMGGGLPSASSAPGVPGFAGGGDFIVPPGYPRDSYLMRVSSGERVTVTPRGEAAGSSARSGHTFIFNVAVSNQRDADYLERKIRALAAHGV